MSEPSSTAGLEGRYASDVAAAVAEGLDLDRLQATVGVGLAAALDDPRIGDATRFVLTGSGDSLFAARSALPAIRRWSGLRAEVMTSIEFARYEVPVLEPGAVVVGISNSGSSSRTRETLALARARGNPTIGITGSLEGPLARLAQHVVHRPIAPPTSVPEVHRRVFTNMVEYLAALVALYSLGLEVGRRRGRLDAAAAAGHRAAIVAAIHRLGAEAARIEPEAIRLAALLGDLDTLWCLGCGPSRGTADYVAAKCHEQIPINGIAQDLEEWAHLEYFLTLAWGSRSVALIHAPPGNAADRALEIVDGMAGAGGRAVLVGGPEVADVQSASAGFALAPIDELLSPLTYHLPGQLLVLHLGDRQGATERPLRRRDDYRLIRKGIVRERPEGLT